MRAGSRRWSKTATRLLPPSPTKSLAGGVSRAPIALVFLGCLLALPPPEPCGPKVKSAEAAGASSARAMLHSAIAIALCRGRWWRLMPIPATPLLIAGSPFAYSTFRAQEPLAKPPGDSLTLNTVSFEGEAEHRSALGIWAHPSWRSGTGELRRQGSSSQLRSRRRCRGCPSSASGLEAVPEPQHAQRRGV